MDWTGLLLPPMMDELFLVEDVIGWLVGGMDGLVEETSGLPPPMVDVLMILDLEEE